MLLNCTEQNVEINKGIFSISTAAACTSHPSLGKVQFHQTTKTFKIKSSYKQINNSFHAWSCTGRLSSMGSPYIGKPTKVLLHSSNWISPYRTIILLGTATCSPHVCANSKSSTRCVNSANSSIDLCFLDCHLWPGGSRGLLLIACKPKFVIFRQRKPIKCNGNYVSIMWRRPLVNKYWCDHPQLLCWITFFVILSHWLLFLHFLYKLDNPFKSCMLWGRALQRLDFFFSPTNFTDDLSD